MVQFLALYLPQYHPIAENDQWWGRGFTEWTNVARARPLYRGHYQPHIPADLGFYDLRLPDTRNAQAELARAHGITGFCYYHYWFKGRRLLERPFNEVLESGAPDFPFCLCWANETWSRRWLGEEKDILIKQTYSPEDDLDHFRWLAKAFSDPRYIKVEGRPLFLVYRPLDLPASTIETFRRESQKLGLPEPYLLGVNSFSDRDYRTVGYDGTVDFRPQLGLLPNALEDSRPRMGRFLRNLKQGVISPTLKLYDISAADAAMHKTRSFPCQPCVTVSWDNTARRGRNAVIFANGSPKEFEQRLSQAVALTNAGVPPMQPIVFINAWNEWAEGNHLEPDLRFGRGYLEAVKRVSESISLNKASSIDIKALPY